MESTSESMTPPVTPIKEASNKDMATPNTKMETSDENMATPMTTPQKMAMGGRKKSRKVNPALKSWVKFVKKIQHEEKLTYPEAMKRASKRKSEWQRGGDGESMVEKDEDDEVDGQQMGGRRRRSRKQRGGEGEVEDDEVDGQQMGGRRRRRRSRSRKQRGGNVADFDSDWKQYGKVGGRRRTRRHRR
jgi:hypothetical protein